MITLLMFSVGTYRVAFWHRGGTEKKASMCTGDILCQEETMTPCTVASSACTMSNPGCHIGTTGRSCGEEKPCKPACCPIPAAISMHRLAAVGVSLRVRGRVRINIRFRVWVWVEPYSQPGLPGLQGSPDSGCMSDWLLVGHRLPPRAYISPPRAYIPQSHGAKLFAARLGFV